MKNAKQLFISVMGTWMGLAGIEHGIGEIMQGNVTAPGVMILSWPDTAFFQILNGEPAMTLISNLLVTGILAITFSILFIIWTIFFSMRSYGGLVMMILAIPMLLFGGGLFPPVLGALIGVAANVQQKKPEQRKMGGIRYWFARNWHWVFAICCLAWFTLLPGVPALDFFFNLDLTWVTAVTMLIAFSMLFLTYWSSIQHDYLVRSNNRELFSIKSADQDSIRSMK